MGKTYDLMIKSYKDYTHYAAQLTKEISNYFLREGLGVTVSVVDDMYIELLFKPNRIDIGKHLQQTADFSELVEKMPETFGLRALRTESTIEEKLDLEEEYRDFYYERVLLRGVDNG